MSLRVTLAVEDWMDRGSLLKQEVKRDSHSPPSPVPLPQVMDLQSDMRLQKHGQALDPLRPLGMLPAGPLAPGDSSGSREVTKGGGLRAGKQPTGLDLG